MAKDIFHDIVRLALEKEGWNITHDPYTVKLTKRQVFIDLAAEKILVAQKDTDLIAVEIKSFLGLSPLTDFYKALGQYQLYGLALKHRSPERVLYLAIPEESYQILTQDELLAQFMLELNLKYIIFNPSNATITKWIN
jgi:XisH protein